jgi:hypothetical protein
MASTDKKTGEKSVEPLVSAASRPRSGKPRTGNSRTGDERDVGTALRAAYQQAVDEKVPSEMLDLLGKLS